MRFRRKKRGYVFTLDVFVAVVILIIGVILLIGLMYYVPRKERTEALSTDIIGVLANVRVNDICSFSPGCLCPSYPSVEALICSEVKNERITLLEFMGQLYYDGNQAIIEQLVDEIIINQEIIPRNYELELRLYDLNNPADVKQIYPLIVSP